MFFTKSTEPKDNGESRVFYRASAIECHQNDVFYKGSTNSVSVINIACPLRSPQSQRTTRKSRVFSRASTIECHQNDVFYEGSTNSISVINIACPLRSPQIQCTAWKSHVFYTASTIVMNVIKMIHKQGSTKGPQTKLVSSTSHVLSAVHRSNAQCGHFKSSTKHHGLSACRRHRMSFTKSTNPTDKVETLCIFLKVFFNSFLLLLLTKSSHTAVVDVLRAFLQRFFIG